MQERSILHFDGGADQRFTPFAKRQNPGGANRRSFCGRRLFCPCFYLSTLVCGEDYSLSFQAPLPFGPMHR
jgi:hypothetical protein